MHGRYIRLAFHGETLMKPAVPLVATGHERGSLLERTYIGSDLKQ